MHNDRFPVRFVDCCERGATTLFSGWYIQGNAARDDDGIGPFNSDDEARRYVLAHGVALDLIYSPEIVCAAARRWRLRDLFRLPRFTNLQGI